MKLKIINNIIGPKKYNTFHDIEDFVDCTYFINKITVYWR